MLNRQYGVAAPSAVVKVTHPEDNQPNEGLFGRNSTAPPRLADTSRPPRYQRGASWSRRHQSQPSGSGSGAWGARGSGHSSASPRPHPPLQNQASWGSKGMRNDTRQAYDGESSGAHGFNPRPTPISMPTKTRHESVTMPPLHLRVPTVSGLQFPSSNFLGEPLWRHTPPRQTSLPVHQMPTVAGLPPRPLLPGRKRKSSELSLSQPPPIQRARIEPDPRQPSNLGQSSVIPISRISDKPTSKSCSTTLVDPPVQIKDEPLSPKAVGSIRKLVTSSCILIPLPDNCQKSNTNYKVIRQAFQKSKISQLRRLGLTIVRAFVRDDGMVAEWSVFFAS